MDSKGNPTRPNPAVTLSNGIIIPGGGWFSMANQQGGDSSDFGKGVLFLIATAGSLALAIDGAGSNSNSKTFIGFGLAFGLRAFDLTLSTSESFRRQEVKSQ